MNVPALNGTKVQFAILGLQFLTPILLGIIGYLFLTMSATVTQSHDMMIELRATTVQNERTLNTQGGKLEELITKYHELDKKVNK